MPPRAAFPHRFPAAAPELAGEEEDEWIDMTDDLTPLPAAAGGEDEVGLGDDAPLQYDPARKFCPACGSAQCAFGTATTYCQSPYCMDETNIMGTEGKGRKVYNWTAAGGAGALRLHGHRLALARKAQKEQLEDDDGSSSSLSESPSESPSENDDAEDEYTYAPPPRRSSPTGMALELAAKKPPGGQTTQTKLRTPVAWTAPLAPLAPPCAAYVSGVLRSSLTSKRKRAAAAPSSADAVSLSDSLSPRCSSSRTKHVQVRYEPNSHGVHHPAHFAPDTHHAPFHLDINYLNTPRMLPPYVPPPPAPRSPHSAHHTAHNANGIIQPH